MSVSEIDDILREIAERKATAQPAEEVPVEETPAEASAEAPVEAPTEAVREETPVEETPVETPAQTPEEEAVQLPAPRAPKRRKKAIRPVPVETPEDAAAARTRRIAEAARRAIEEQVAIEAAEIDAELEAAAQEEQAMQPDMRIPLDPDAPTEAVYQAIFEQETAAQPDDEGVAVSADEAAEDTELTRVIPVVQAADENAQEDTEQTRVILSQDNETPVQRTPAPAPEPEDDQLTLAGFGEEPLDEELAAVQQEILETGESGADWEARLRRTREEKIAAFRRQMATGDSGAFQISGDEETAATTAQVQTDDQTDEDGVIDEYSAPEYAEAVRHELHYRRNNGWLMVALTVVLEIILVVVTLIASTNGGGVGGTLYVVLNLILFGIAIGLNHETVMAGVRALLARNPTTDAASTVCTAAVLLHTLLAFIPAVLEASHMQLLTPLAVLSLLFGSLGRQARILRTCENFEFVSDAERTFFAARRVEDKRSAEEIGRPAVAVGEPHVAFFKKTNFLTRFLQSSYATDCADAVIGRLLIGVGAAAALLTVLFGIIRGNWLLALYIGICGLCLGIPAAQTAVNFPLYRTAKQLLRRGGMLGSWLAVEEFGDLHGVAVQGVDLFPEGTVQIRGMRVFKGTRIDEAILTAAGILHSAGGTLGRLFDDIIQQRNDILPEAENIVYEQGMGVSGWIHGRRVFVGNRRLLENHGITPPSLDFELRHTERGNLYPVYLAVSGDMSAMFLVSYTADEDIMEALQRLCNEGVTLLVRTTDPNISQIMLCDLFDLDSYYVEILGHTGASAVAELLDNTVMDCPAVLAASGGFDSCAETVTCCKRLRTRVRLALCAQIVGSVLGFALCAAIALFGGNMMSLPACLLLMSGFALLSWVIPALCRP